MRNLINKFRYRVGKRILQWPLTDSPVGVKILENNLSSVGTLVWCVLKISPLEGVETEGEIVSGSLSELEDFVRHQEQAIANIGSEKSENQTNEWG